MDINSLLSEFTPRCEVISRTFARLSTQEKIAWMYSLKRSHMMRLYEAFEGFLPVTLQDLVPEQIPSMVPIRHIGINNLPLARKFEKVMYRTPSGMIAGRNVQPLAPITGHGYFTALNSSTKSGFEVDICYQTLPTEKPDTWPNIESNARGLSYFIYRDLKDTLRRVSDDVLIGHATRNNQPLPNYFMLIRESLAVGSGVPEYNLAAAGS